MDDAGKAIEAEKGEAGTALGWNLVDLSRLKEPPTAVAAAIYIVAAFIALVGLAIGVLAFIHFGYQMFVGKPEHRIEAAKIFFPVLVALIGGPVLIWRALTAHWAAQYRRTAWRGRRCGPAAC